MELATLIVNALVTVVLAYLAYLVGKTKEDVGKVHTATNSLVKQLIDNAEEKGETSGRAAQRAEDAATRQQEEQGG